MGSKKRSTREKIQSAYDGCSGCYRRGSSSNPKLFSCDWIPAMSENPVRRRIDEEVAEAVKAARLRPEETPEEQQARWNKEWNTIEAIVEGIAGKSKH
ncbi:TPA: hypothetical protein DDX46_01515 [Candidatus Saccharibacteria bacterium]|nr:MAG: hypothetical protein A3E20_00970 [Candidatus Saccharibacteria bacterium RIFCSPHIGHO2_12_FULL_47_16]HBH77407.1 hypothetical protein [Candidatus Saccharibacteria bacterium]